METINDRERIGKVITELRQRRGLTTRQLAELAGVTQCNISKIENGKYNVGVDTLAKILKPMGGKLVVDVAEQHKAEDDRAVK